MNMKEWCAEKQKERLQELVEYFGDVATLARFLQLPFHTVYAWQARGKISAAGAKRIEKATAGRFSAGYLNPTAIEWFHETNKAGSNAKD